LYLTEDYTGAASGILYGKKGDRVSVISKEGNMVLVELDGIRFHTQESRLSKGKVEKDIVKEVVKRKK
jgi:uncharacterized Rossmann fold enzyme